jgi:hypothetical protein
MTESKHGLVKVITFDENGNEVIEWVNPSAKRNRQKSKPSAQTVPKVPQKYAKIIPAIRRRWENKMPCAAETETLFKYFEMKSTHFLCSKIPSGKEITLCGEEFIFCYDNKRVDHSAKDYICNTLFLHFFSDDGWIMKNSAYQNLSDDELFDKFDDRMLNVLRDAVPKKQRKIISMAEARDYFKDDGRDNWEDVRDGVDIVTKDEEFEAKVTRDIKRSGQHFEDESSIREKGRALCDDLIDVLIGSIDGYKNVYDFKAKLIKEFGSNPAILTNYIRQKYKHYPLVQRWLINIFPERIEPYRAISKAKRDDQGSFIEELYWKYGADWEKKIAYEAASYEGARRLEGKPFEDRQEILKEMVDFYRKYAKSIRWQKIEETALTARNTIEKESKNRKSHEEKLINLLWEHYVSQ